MDSMKDEITPAVVRGVRAGKMRVQRKENIPAVVLPGHDVLTQGVGGRVVCDTIYHVSIN